VFAVLVSFDRDALDVDRGHTINRTETYAKPQEPSYVEVTRGPETTNSSLNLSGTSYSASSDWFEGRKTRFQPQTDNGKRFLLSVCSGVSTLADISVPILGSPVLRQNLVTIDIVDFLQPSTTLYWYGGITIFAVLLFQSIT
jgi:hypothetical protein